MHVPGTRTVCRYIIVSYSYDYLYYLILYSSVQYSTVGTIHCRGTVHSTARMVSYEDRAAWWCSTSMASTLVAHGLYSTRPPHKGIFLQHMANKRPTPEDRRTSSVCQHGVSDAKLAFFSPCLSDTPRDDAIGNFWEWNMKWFMVLPKEAALDSWICGNSAAALLPFPIVMILRLGHTHREKFAELSETRIALFVTRIDGLWSSPRIVQKISSPTVQR